MSIADRVWNTLTAMVKIEDRLTRQDRDLDNQQMKIENLTERVIRLEAQFELLTRASLVKRLKAE